MKDRPESWRLSKLERILRKKYYALHILKTADDTDPIYIMADGKPYPGRMHRFKLYLKNGIIVSIIKGSGTWTMVGGYPGLMEITAWREAGGLYCQPVASGLTVRKVLYIIRQMIKLKAE